MRILKCTGCDTRKFFWKNTSAEKAGWYFDRAPKIVFCPMCIQKINQIPPVEPVIGPIRLPTYKTACVTDIDIKMN